MGRRRSWVASLALVASLAYGNSAQAATPRTGKVVNTDGAALRMRAAPTAGAPIVKRLGPGWRITVLGVGSDDQQWLKVEHGGDTGYVAAAYVALDGEQRGGDGAKRAAWVGNTDGAALRLREQPAAGAAILKRLEPGWKVTVIGEAVAGGRWYVVEHAGVTGYAAAGYLRFQEPSGPPPPTPPADSGTARQGWVANTDGSRLRVRSLPRDDAPILKRLEPGWQVTIVGGPVTAGDGSQWVKIEHAGTVGYAAAGFIAGSAAGGGEATPPDSQGPVTGRFVVSEAVRLRHEASLAAPVVMTLTPGTTVERTGLEVSADGLRWASVRVFGRDGWVSVSALAQLPGPGLGQDLADAASAQMGRPYVWGGETPSRGFDCSGLVRFVVQRVTGVDLSHVLAYQAQAGSPVERDELQIGDMVFFKDTYKPGLSHVGFYVGNGQFVSALNEKVGVAKANLNDRYWSTRYYGARRLNSR